MTRAELFALTKEELAKKTKTQLIDMIIDAGSKKEVVSNLDNDFMIHVDNDVVTWTNKSNTFSPVWRVCQHYVADSGLTETHKVKGKYVTTLKNKADAKKLIDGWIAKQAAYGK